MKIFQPSLDIKKSLEQKRLILDMKRKSNYKLIESNFQLIEICLFSPTDWNNTEPDFPNASHSFFYVELGKDARFNIREFFKKFKSRWWMRWHSRKQRLFQVFGTGRWFLKRISVWQILAEVSNWFFTYRGRFVF